MISILIYCHKEREAKELCQLCRYCIALLGDDHLLPHMYYDELDSLRGRAVLQMGTGSMLEQREKRGLPDLVKSIGMSPDMILFEIRGQADLLQLEKIRRCFPDALLAILADSRISPDRYLHPAFRPIMLLLRPLEPKKAMACLRQLFGYYYEQRDGMADKNRLVIRGREEIRYLRYGRIMYMEARDKKIFLRYDREEISFYHSLKKLEELLPEYFVRCHRSYLVNARYISQINFSQSTLSLTDNIVIPVSQKYRKMILHLLGEEEGIFCENTQ